MTEEKHDASTLAPTEKSEGSDYQSPHDKEFQPIATSSRPRDQNGSLHHSISRTRSQNGYGCDDESENVDDEVAEDGSDPYDVQWSGDDDPMNPRNMKHAKKWVVVIIVSLSSMCV